MAFHGFSVVEERWGAMTHEQNLLFAAFAVQLRMVPAPQALEATASWAVDPSVGVAERLWRMGCLSPEGREMLVRLVEGATAEFEGDAAPALKAALEDEYFCGKYFDRFVLHEPQGNEKSTVAGPGAGLADVEPFEVTRETPGRYKGESEYARGGMGRVLLVHDGHLGRDIAMKELLPNISHSGETLSVEAPSPVRMSVPLIARFLQEARITGQLEHPSIVPVYELGHRKDGRLYYTMKLVRGRTLARAIRQAEDLTGRLALLTHVADLCQAVAYAHSRGVLHRDIKPSNVMVGEFGETVVLDWGLAKARNRPDVHEEGFAEALKALNVGGDAELSKTSYGQIVGTPAYMPPEQARGDLDRVDERSDVYSLGAVLYELLTGATPHVGASKLEILLHVLERPIRAIEDIAPDAPPELVAICNRALQKDPAQRYPSAKELAEDVRRFQSGAVVRAYDYSLRQQMLRFYQRNRSTVRTAAVALLVLFAGLSYYNVRLYQSREGERAQRLAAEQSNARLQEEVYASTIVAAQKYVNELNVERALEYLGRCPEEKRGWEWGYLMRACRPFLSEAPHDVLKVGTANPLRCRFSDDGRLVLSKWNSGGVVNIFDRTTGQYIYYSPVDVFRGFPRTADFGPDPGHFTAGTNYTTVAYYDWQNQQTVRQFSIASGWLTSFKVSADARFAAGTAYDNTTGAREVIVWDFQTGAEMRRVALAPRPDPGLGGNQPQYREYAIMAAHPLGIVGGFIDGGKQLVFSDEAVCVLNLESGEVRRTVDCRDGIFDLDATRGWAVYVRGDGTVGQWDLMNDVALPDLAGSAAAVEAVYGGRDTPYVAVREAREQWSLWKADTGELLDRHQSDTLSLWGLDVADTEPVAVTLAAGSHLRFWQVGPSRVTETVELAGADGQSATHNVFNPYVWPYRSFAVHPSRTLLAILDMDNNVSLWRVPEMTLVRKWTPHDAKVMEMAFSQDGSLMTTTAWDGWAKVWDVATGEEVRAFAPEFDEACYTAAIAPDNATIALGYGERSTVDRAQSITPFYDLRTGELKRRVDLEGYRVNKLAYSRDGGLLFVGVWGLNGSGDHSFEIYRTNDLARPAARVNGLGWGDQIDFDLDGSHALLHGGSLNPVYFDLKTLKVVYESPKSQAMTVSFHPDGGRFVTAVHFLHQALVHRASDGRILAALDGVLGPAFFSADGKDLYSLTKDGKFRVFHTEEWAGAGTPK